MDAAQADPDVGAREGLRRRLGEGFDALEGFAAMLSDEGVLRGLVGPRELPRLWERHLLNSAAVEPFLPPEGTVMDVGSGAGLPGVVLACMRPEQHVILLEPMERRASWLSEVVASLGLSSVEVVRARAEEVHGRLTVAAVTARAVAPMDRLARWTLPLVEVGGVLVALKGSRAAQEVAEATAEIARLGGSAPEVLEASTLEGFPPTTVVRVRKTQASTVGQRGRRPRAGR